MIASVSFPKTSTRTGPKSFDMRSRELVVNQKQQECTKNSGTHPQSIYSMHMITSPELWRNAP